MLFRSPQNPKTPRDVWIAFYNVEMLSEDEKEEDQDEQFDDDDDPEVAVVCCLEQVLHFVVRIDHVALGAINVITKLLDPHVLRLDLFPEILGLVLSRFDNAYHFIKLFVLVLNHSLLDRQHLPIFQVPRLVELAIFASF